MPPKLTNYYQVMHIKHLLAPNKKVVWTALFWTFIIVVLCFKTPSVEKRLYFTNADKIAHFSFYFGFVVLWYRHLAYKKCTTITSKTYLVIVAIILGILIELGQGYFTTTRQTDFWDVVANSSGCLGGMIFVNLFLKNYKMTTYD
jgi:VanZ family protein